MLSFYEVVSLSEDKKIILNDLLMGGEFDLSDKILTKGLKKGDIFATRLLPLDGRFVMSSCVYPYGKDSRQSVLTDIDTQFGRYKRNVKPEGTMKDFLKDYGDVLNIIWMKMIMCSSK